MCFIHAYLPSVVWLVTSVFPNSEQLPCLDCRASRLVYAYFSLAEGMNLSTMVVIIVNIVAICLLQGGNLYFSSLFGESV